MHDVAQDVEAIIKILAESDIGMKNVIVNQRALELGIDGERLDEALEYAGQKDWIEGGPHETVLLTSAGRRAAAGVKDLGTGD